MVFIFPYLFWLKTQSFLSVSSARQVHKNRECFFNSFEMRELTFMQILKVPNTDKLWLYVN